MTILIPELHCAYKTKIGIICVCSFEYSFGSTEMTIIDNYSLIRKNLHFYLDKNGHLESNCRNSWIKHTESFELVEQLTFKQTEKYNWDDY
jgi:hypothetical protein